LFGLCVVVAYVILLGQQIINGHQDPTKQSKVGAAAAKTIADCVVTGPCAAAVVEQCSFCRWRPCFMDRDENYENMLVLGSQLEGQRKPYSSIRLSLISEMSRRFRCRPSLPYCVIREIRDAYPPVRHVVKLKGNKK
jgi:hypothetical protein